MFYICSHDEKLEIPDPPKPFLWPPFAEADHPRRAEPHAWKRPSASSGSSASSIAAFRCQRSRRSEGLSLKRMRNVVREILAERMPQPPAEFLALQVSRLNEALLVSLQRDAHRSGGNELRGCRSRGQNRPRARPLSRLRRRPAAARRAGGAPPSAARRASARARRPRPRDSRITPQAIENAQSGLADSPPHGRREIGVLPHAPDEAGVEASPRRGALHDRLRVDAGQRAVIVRARRLDARAAEGVGDRRAGAEQRRRLKPDARAGRRDRGRGSRSRRGRAGRP